MRPNRPTPGRRLLGLIVALLAAAALAPTAARAQATPDAPEPAPAAAEACAGTFQVLSDTRIGELRLAKGPYALSPQGGLSCSSAAQQFTTFLNTSYDGDLASPWRLDVAERRFLRGTAADAAGFTVRPLESGGDAETGEGCPTPYTQPRRATVGSLTVPRGRFALTLVRGTATCQQLTELLTSFLQSRRDALPRGWSYSRQSGTFTNAGRRLAFRFTLVGEVVEGGGSFPARGTICPSSATIAATDRFGAYRVQRGRYAVAVFGRTTCADARRWVAAFGRKTDGRLHRPWVVDADTATFTRGRGAANGFQLSRVT